MRVCILADNASTRFGGEAVLPFHYFRFLRRRGIDAWLIAHARVRDELLELLPEERNRMYFVPDTRLHKVSFRLLRYLPRRIGEPTLWLLMLLTTQWAQRPILRRLIREQAIDVLHQPAPVAPTFPSMYFGLGRPLIVGPMNGGMEYPPAFRSQDSLAGRLFVQVSRRLSTLANLLLPGKRRAQVLLVANPRTARALPGGMLGRVVELVENGVDLERWQPQPAPETTTHFVFLGRLVDWKALPIAFEALARVPAATLEVIGDGAMRQAWEADAARLGVRNRVDFRGWRTQEESAAALGRAAALLLPSLFECGGAVVLEAMATGRPVIATAWGGPLDYLDPATGFLVEPTSHEALVAGFAAAMQRLIEDPALVARMGTAARERVLRDFTWQGKIDRMLEIYQAEIARSGAS